MCVCALCHMIVACLALCHVRGLCSGDTVVAVLFVIGVFYPSLVANISGSSDWFPAILGLFESSGLGLYVVQISYGLD